MVLDHFYYIMSGAVQCYELFLEGGNLALFVHCLSLGILCGVHSNVNHILGKLLSNQRHTLWLCNIIFWQAGILRRVFIYQVLITTSMALWSTH